MRLEKRLQSHEWAICLQTMQENVATGPGHTQRQFHTTADVCLPSFSEEKTMNDLTRFLNSVRARDFSGAYQAALIASLRRKLQRMSSSETRPRRSTRELMARRAPTEATSKSA